ncbi:4-hydroxybenzoate octaprenyltransferase [Fontimonas sp. SYSU GA230001]|uniref:4-hydroxybenzoate octaprenyltransferase n=1 Tax=Fontimonas sp. SYSU GA230001 TaxID=3142450 RepID=UPI0032B38017
MTTPLPGKFRDYLLLMRLDRPIGIYLLLWPTLWGLWFAAHGLPDLHVLLVFVAGTALMRSAGCAINDFADRDFDPHVARTKDRPLAAGRVKPDEAVRLFVAVSLIAFGLLTSLKNTLAIALAVPAVILAAGYPFMKRFISMPQAVLGLAFSWGIPMAYAAVRHAVAWTEVLPLMVANVCWVIAYDTWYAMVDRADDLRIGVKSSAILFGRHDRLAIALLQATALIALIWLGTETGRGEWYYGGIAVAAWLAVYQQWITRGREPAACFRAFLHNNWFGLAIFAGLALDYAL